MATPKEQRQLHELHKYHDPKCDSYEECELQEHAVPVVNKDGVVDEIPLSQLPDYENDPWWVKFLRRLVGCA